MTKYFDTKNGTLENAVLSVYEKKLDPVNKDAVKKKFDDRKDKDIDNDGESTSPSLSISLSFLSSNFFFTASLFTGSNFFS